MKESVKEWNDLNASLRKIAEKIRVHNRKVCMDFMETLEEYDWIKDSAKGNHE